MGTMLLCQAILESIIVFVVILFFKSMYFNKYGQADTNKDDLSDYSNDIEHDSSKNLNIIKEELQELENSN